MNTCLKISLLSGVLLLLAGCAADVYTPYYPQQATPNYRQYGQQYPYGVPHDNGNHYGQRKHYVYDNADDDRGYSVAPQRYNDSHAYKKHKKHHGHGHDD